MEQWYHLTRSMSNVSAKTEKFLAMPEFVELPPIATEALSLILLADNDASPPEQVVADWVAYLNGLDREYEILLVDDGASDNTAQLTTALTDRFRRLRILRHPARRG